MNRQSRRAICQWNAVELLLHRLEAAEVIDDILWQSAYFEGSLRHSQWDDEFAWVDSRRQRHSGRTDGAVAVSIGI